MTMDTTSVCGASSVAPSCSEMFFPLRSARRLKSAKPPRSFLI
jgi:hypothetical protein